MTKAKITIGIAALSIAISLLSIGVSLYTIRLNNEMAARFY